MAVAWRGEKVLSSGVAEFNRRPNWKFYKRAKSGSDAQRIFKGTANDFPSPWGLTRANSAR
jgi:hypothetical protein